MPAFTTNLPSRVREAFQVRRFKPTSSTDRSKIDLWQSTYKDLGSFPRFTTSRDRDSISPIDFQPDVPVTLGMWWKRPKESNSVHLHFLFTGCSAIDSSHTTLLSYHNSVNRFSHYAHDEGVDSINAWRPGDDDPWVFTTVRVDPDGLANPAIIPADMTLSGHPNYPYGGSAYQQTDALDIYDYGASNVDSYYRLSLCCRHAGANYVWQSDTDSGPAVCLDYCLSRKELYELALNPWPFLDRQWGHVLFFTSPITGEDFGPYGWDFSVQSGLNSTLDPVGYVPYIDYSRSAVLGSQLQTFVFGSTEQTVSTTTPTITWTAASPTVSSEVELSTTTPTITWTAASPTVSSEVELSTTTPTITCTAAAPTVSSEVELSTTTPTITWRAANLEAFRRRIIEDTATIELSVLDDVEMNMTLDDRATMMLTVEDSVDSVDFERISDG